MMVEKAGMPSRSALKAVSAISEWVSLSPSMMAVSMGSCRDSWKKKLKSLSCSQMKPIVRIETSLTIKSSLRMLAVIF